jgi:Uncharacterised nucleotidyltransferase
MWPSSLQLPLLRAAFLSNEAGIQAWKQWKSHVDMRDHPDLGSFRLLPQLYHNLQAVGVTDPAMMKFKGVARQNWYSNQRCLRTAAPTLQALHEAGIESILLYGPAFALKYCGDYALPPETSLAVLVRTQQAPQAIRHLRVLGWRPDKQLPHFLLEAYVAAGRMHIFRNAEGRKIHLYWHLLPQCRAPDADAGVWDDAVATNLHDVPVRLLSPADQILHSCLESGSSIERSMFLRAIDAMLVISATPDLDWDRLLTRAEKHRVVAPLLAVLGYIQGSLDEPLPPEVWQRLQSLSISEQERLEYKLKSSHPLLWRRFWGIWCDYRRYTSSLSLAQGVAGFPWYLQHFWGLADLRQVPIQAMSILWRHLRRSKSTTWPSLPFSRSGDRL